MTQHTELIERLRRERRTTSYAAAAALEAQAREIAELKAQLAATTKNAFEAMPHDIPTRMKDAICEETGWSGSMVSRMYTELRKAFTGEPYKVNEDLDAALLEVERLRKDAACFRFWVREAAVNPCDMAKLIMRCTTEQEYRDAIEPLATAAEDAIRAAMKGQP